jgi:hypothetical protein
MVAASSRSTDASNGGGVPARAGAVAKAEITIVATTR